MAPASVADAPVALFDLDGTLVDSAPGIIRCLALTLRHYGADVPPDARLRGAVGPPVPETLQRLTGFDAERTAEVVAYYRRLYLQRGIEESSVFPGVREMLDGLRSAGLRLVVATSKRRSHAVAILELHGLAAAFEAVCGANEDESGSAKAEVMARALAAVRDAGTLPRPIMVGDRSHDVAGARAHDLPALFAEWGYGDPSEGADADWSAASPAGAAEILREALVEARAHGPVEESSAPTDPPAPSSSSPTV
jgi:phosphoglycolate phosphatase